MSANSYSNGSPSQRGFAPSRNLGLIILGLNAAVRAFSNLPSSSADLPAGVSLGFGAAFSRPLAGLRGDCHPEDGRADRF
eukprot:4353331-Pyramimonas_sp.AAC.1